MPFISVFSERIKTCEGITQKKDTTLWTLSMMLVCLKTLLKLVHYWN